MCGEEIWAEINSEAGKLRKFYPQIRKGQALINIFSELYPDKAKEISGTEIDCFYVDDKIPEFKAYVLSL